MLWMRHLTLLDTSLSRDTCVQSHGSTIELDLLHGKLVSASLWYNEFQLYLSLISRGLDWSTTVLSSRSSGLALASELLTCASHLTRFTSRSLPCYHKQTSAVSSRPSSEDQIWTKGRSDWHKMGQIREFFRSHFCRYTSPWQWDQEMRTFWHRTEIWCEQVPNVSLLVPSWPTFDPHLTFPA